MNHQDAKLRSLLQLKKLETPGSQYFDAFLDEFHRYQRAEILRTPTWQERVSEWIHAWAHVPRVTSWTAAGAVACMLLLLGIAGLHHDEPVSGLTASAPAHSEVDYVQPTSSSAALINAPEELGIATASSFDKDFASPRYVTGQVLVAYDTSIAF
jgi:hypothetical protein